MRLLCLHGKGTSAAIFQSQTTSVRQYLSADDFRFDFVDAPLLCQAAAGIDVFYRGPYYSFYDSVDQASLQPAHRWLESLLQSRGPYDAVMCFSQGCGLVSTYLVSLELQGLPSPFKSAMFICGGIPLQFLEDHGVKIPEIMHQIDRESRDALSQQADDGALLAQGDNRWTGFTTPLVSLGSMILSASTQEVEDQAFISVSRNMMIKIPTAHVFGRLDPRYIASLQLAKLCDEKVSRVFDHEGGHTIPRTSKVSMEMAELLDWMRSFCHR